MVPHRTNWRRQQIAVYWFGLQMAHDEGLVFWQTISTAIILNDSTPADCLLKVVKRNHEKLYQRTQPESQVTPQVVLRASWRQDQLSSEKPEACCSSSDHLSPVKLGATTVAWVPRVDTRSQRVPHAESDEEEHWKKLISGVVRAMLTDPDKDKLVQNLPSRRTRASAKTQRCTFGCGIIQQDSNCANCPRKFKCTHCPRD